MRGLVEVDPATGKISILDWSSAEDAGRTLHPDLLEGQIQGGIAQGIGYALGEDLLLDPSGTMLNPSMVDYQVPTAPQIPLIEDKLHTLASDDPAHPLRNKGIGESGVTPAARRHRQRRPRRHRRPDHQPPPDPGEGPRRHRPPPRPIAQSTT